MTDLGFFLPHGPHGFVPTDWVRGPWSVDRCHGGPLAALGGLGLESLGLGPGFHWARVSVELLRAAPLAPIDWAVEEDRQTRRTRRATVHLAIDGEVVARVSGLAVAIDPPSEPVETFAPEDPGGVALAFPHLAGRPGFHEAIEARRVGERTWLTARGPLVVGRPTSPLERTLLLADSASGIAPPAPFATHTFANPELLVLRSRELVGEWLGLEVETSPGASGVALTDARLVDLKGPLGRALQVLSVRPRDQG